MTTKSIDVDDEAALDAQLAELNDPSDEADTITTEPTTKKKPAAKKAAAKKQPAKKSEGSAVPTAFVPAESVYAKVISNHPDFAISERDENVSMYHWEGNYWKELTKHEAVKHAFQWLKQKAKEVASARMAREAHSTALLDGKPLPEQTKETIIPLENCWIKVGDTGELAVIKPAREMGITYKIKAKLNTKGTVYKPKTLPASSRFHKFLETSLPKQDVRDFVQEYCAYTLLPDTRFQIASMWLGKGMNGKSILLNIISALHNKVAAIRLDSLDDFGIYPLLNASLAVSAETPKKGINEQILKACITSDSISMEGKNKNEFRYQPTAKWIMNANSFPKITDESDGVWRRLMIVEWDVQVSKENQVKNLDNLIIEQELHLVVDWCLEGLQRLLKRGDFLIPESVIRAGKREQEVSNTVAQFTDAHFVEEDTQCGLTKDYILQTYIDYCKVQNYMPLGNVEFWKRIRLQFPKLIEKKKNIVNDDKKTAVRKNFVNLRFNMDDVDELRDADEKEAARLFGQNTQQPAPAPK